MLGVWGCHPGFHREQLGEQTQGDVAGNVAPRADGGTRESALPEGAVTEQKQGKGRQDSPGEAQGLWPSPEVQWLHPCGANSFFRLAVGFAARTMDIAVVIPVIILYKQG